MRIVLEFSRLIADAIEAAAHESGVEPSDIVAEAVRSSPIVQRLLAIQYPSELTDLLKSDASHE